MIGTRFTGRLVEETTVGGVAAVIPEITGRAWITGMGQYLLDAEDPFPAGFARLAERRLPAEPPARGSATVGSGVCRRAMTRSRPSSSS